MKFKKFFYASLMVAGAFCTSASADTFTFTSGMVGNGVDYTFNYNKDIDGAFLRATVTFDLYDLKDTTAGFHVVVTNNSFGVGTNRLVSFGVDVVNPPLTNAFTSGSNEWLASLDQKLPSFPRVDLCAYAGPTCAGGAGGPVPNGTVFGSPDSFDLLLTFKSGAAGGVTFNSPFPSKWQSVGRSLQSQEFDVCTATGSCVTDPPTQIPEPTTLALAGIALLGLAATRRRRA